ncbi:MAG: histidine kinase dimerization/phospho-acceptor domain-containing protein [Candidatus Zixiibacteriota bacterium]
MSKSELKTLHFSFIDEVGNQSGQLSERLNDNNNNYNDFAGSINSLKIKLATGQYDNLIIYIDNDIQKYKLLNIINLAIHSKVTVEVINQHQKDTQRFSIIANKKTDEGSLFNEDTERYDSENDKLKILMHTVATLNHEINNSLLAISANAEMLRDQLEKIDSKSSEKAKTISQATDHIRKVLQNLGRLKSISYIDTAAGKMININDYPDFGVRNGIELEEEILTK